MTLIAAIAAIVGLAAMGLLGANLLRDRGVEVSVTRRLAAVLGGAAYLIAVLCLAPWTALGISASVALLILTIRLRFRGLMRGLSEPAASHRWAVVAYPVAATMSLALGWGVLNDKWLAFLPIAFMAWGDNAAGLVRESAASSRWSGGAWPSIAMLGVCWISAGLYQPYWIGAVGAGAATAAERFRPTANPLWDDNRIIVAASLAAMAGLVAFGG